MKTNKLGECKKCGIVASEHPWSQCKDQPIKPLHTPTPDAVILARYEIVNRYLQNQCPLSWEQLVKTIIGAQPEVVRAVNAYEKDQEIIRELLKALKNMNNVEEAYCICPANDGHLPYEEHATICVMAQKAISKSEGK